jgi:hypothetical protein
VPTESIEMLQGTLDLLVLKTLSWGTTHGYGIARWIQHVTDDMLRAEEGSLYPALHRLEKRGSKSRLVAMIFGPNTAKARGLNSLVGVDSLRRTGKPVAFP